ncbi:phosphotransferase family protein [Terrabacter terrigena]|uniref:Phosphotransferase family protein n=1 Tax=Terrabacter terrigena TaxID=574718 RepID=A0ABW3MRY7_9MICO
MNHQVVEGLLDEQSVVAYVQDRGLLAGHSVTASALSGGVSNVVLAVDDGHRRVVVKQSLGRLRVRDEWHAPRERVIAEAAALDHVRCLTPSRVPGVVHRDRANNVIVIEGAPGQWRDWKTQLLHGDVNPPVGGQLGEVLGRWQRLTLRAELPAEVHGQSSFDVLRLEPYYRTAARRRPELSAQILALAEELSTRRLCLVHGDFSPKNVLVGPPEEELPLWVIDFEVAHHGHPVFDLAFMASHLTLKAIHRPAWAPRYDNCLREFLGAYAREVSSDGGSAESGLSPRMSSMLSHVGALLVARVVGRSPAEYLSAKEKAHSLALGVALLREPRDELEGLFELRNVLVS